MDRTAHVTPAPETSPYYAMVTSLYSIPLILSVAGCRERADFVYCSNQSGTPLLYRRDLSAATTQLVTPEGMPVTGPFVLHATGSSFVFAQDTEGDEEYVLHHGDFNGTSRRIPSRSLGRVMHLFWATDDSWIVVGNDQHSAYVRLVMEDGSTRDLFTTDQQLLTAAYDDRRNLVVVSVGRGAGTRLAVVDVAAAQVRHWIAEAEQAEATLPAVYPPCGNLAYASSAPTGSWELVIRSIDTLDELVRVAVPGEFDWLGGSIEWQDATTIVGVMTRAGRFVLQTLDLESGLWSAPLHDGSAWSMSVTAHGPVWVDTSFVQPPRVQCLSDGQVTTLIAAPPAGTPVTAEDHRYTSFDGREVQGWLIKCAQADAPLVVYCHGGPTFMTGNWWDPTILALVRAGYHVFAPNFRGSIGFGTEFKQLNIGDVGGGDLQDVKYGAKYVAACLGRDDRPAILGASYGGYLALQALTTQPETWAGGVAIAATADWADEYQRSDAHFRFYAEYFFGGTPDERPELYHDRSPINHAHRLKAPLLVIHGEHDPRCPIEPVRRFVAIARQHDLPVQLVVTQDEGHGASQNVNAIRDTVLALEHLRTVFS